MRIVNVQSGETYSGRHSLDGAQTIVSEILENGPDNPEMTAKNRAKITDSIPPSILERNFQGIRVEPQSCFANFNPLWVLFYISMIMAA